MSFEEDYLMAKVKELDSRLAKVEKEVGPRRPLVGVLVEEDAPHQDSPQDEDEYGSWSFADLRTEAKRRGLNAGGTAEELAARLREDDQESL